MISEIKSSATSTSSAPTNYNSIVNASATTTASSNVSLFDSENIAKNLATNIAKDIAMHDANVINQSVNIVNQQFIQPLEKKQNTITSTDNVRLDQVIASLDAFKSAIYNVNYLSDLINKNKEQIIKAGQYASVLQPIIEKKYYNQKDVDFWACRLNPSEDKYIAYLFNKYPFWNNCTLKQIKNINKNNNLEKFNESLDINLINACNILQKLIEKYPKNKSYYYFSVMPWKNSLSLKINFFQKDLLDDSEYSSIGARILLENFIPNTNDLSNFSQEYLTFINEIANTIGVINDTKFEPDFIWPYINPIDFSTSKCIYSKIYPQFSGQLIQNCYIPGSNINFPEIILNQINDLYYNYPTLSIDDIALLTYNIQDKNYLSLVKIDNLNGILCFKEKQIEINDFFTNTLNINNDVIINGSLNVQTYDNQNIIQTDNVNKVTVFNNKIGINQEISSVKGFLDIDNISNTFFLDLLSQFIEPQNISYTAVNILKNISSDILNNFDKLTHFIDNNEILKYFSDEIVIFKSPIKNIVQEKEVLFLYTNDNLMPFSSRMFDNNSFSKIVTIINEINKIMDEMNNKNDIYDSIFSFVELLNDTNYSYMNSIRSFIIKDEIFFVTVSLNVNSITINPNYYIIFSSIIDRLSRLNRFINYSVLVFKEPHIYEMLLKGESVNSITSYIDNSSYFRDRFGLKNFGFNNSYLVGARGNEYVFHENKPQWNLKKMSELVFKNKDIKIEDIHNLFINSYNKSYNENYVNQNFVVNYVWERQEKVAIVQRFILNNIKYTMTCGIDLLSCIDNSVLSKGDIKSKGQFTIEDNFEQPIFKIDTNNKTISNIYNVSIGKSEPNTKLDVYDIGMNDIINVIDSLTKIYNTINNNISQITYTNIGSIIPSFIDTLTNSKIKQTNESYYYINLLNIDQPEKCKTIYHWLYPEWKNQILNENNDIQNKESVINAINFMNQIITKNLIYKNSNTINIYDWVFGIKINISRNLLLNGNVYLVGSGVNIQNMNCNINTNKNVYSFFECLSTLNLYLEYIVSSFYNKDVTKIDNYPVVNNYFNKIKSLYPFNSAKFTKICLNFDNPYYTTVTSMSWDETQNVLIDKNDTQILINITDENLRFKYINLTIQIRKFYKNLKEGDYGIVHFEDENLDFFGLFYCINNNTILCLDYKISNIIFPSIDLRGDCRINGDLVVKDINNIRNDESYLSVDPVLKFVGINTDIRYINYPFTFAVNSTTNNYSSQHHVYISKDTNPVFCCERIQEKSSDIVNPSTDIDALVKDSKNSYSNFRSFSAATIRRKSKLYSFEEMYNYTQANSIIRKNSAKYGCEIAVEITDKNDYSSFIGNFGMVIDSLDEKKNIRSGFISRTYDVDPLTNAYKQPRQILYVDSDSTLYVDNIVVGKSTPLSVATGPSNIKVDTITLGNYNISVDTNGNLLFNGKKVKLED